MDTMVKALSTLVEGWNGSYSYVMTIRTFTLRKRRSRGNIRTATCKSSTQRELFFYLQTLTLADIFNSTPANYVCRIFGLLSCLLMIPPVPRSSSSDSPRLPQTCELLIHTFCGALLMEFSAHLVFLQKLVASPQGPLRSL